MALSSAEAEYRAITSTASELTWTKQILTVLNFWIDEPMQIFCDNQSARHIAANPVFHERTKNIEVDYHFIREKIQSKEIVTPFVKSENQFVDIFIKGLSIRIFKDICCKLGLFNLYKS
jgi:hypothetical protein